MTTTYDHGKTLVVPHVIGCVIAFATAALLFQRRSYFPLKGMQYQGPMLTAIFIGFALLNIGFLNAFCLAQSIIGYYSVLFITSCYTCRGFVLLFRFKILADIQTFKAGGRPGWFLQRRNWISPRNVALMLIADGLIFTAALLIFLATRHWQCQPVPANNLRSLLCFIHVLGCALEAWYLRDFGHDGLGIKRELTVAAVVAIVALLTYQIGSKFAHTTTSNIEVQVVASSLACIALYLTTCAWPLIVSCRGYAGSKHHHLKQVLMEPKGREAFFGFLQSEFSTENMLFWDAVQTWKKASLELNLETRPLPRQLQTMIDNIIQQYVNDSAHLVVNIAASTRKDILTTVQEWKSNNWDVSVSTAMPLFDRAEAEVFRLMNDDSFPRFWKLQGGSQDHPSGGGTGSSHRTNNNNNNSKGIGSSKRGENYNANNNNSQQGGRPTSPGSPRSLDRSSSVIEMGGGSSESNSVVTKPGKDVGGRLSVMQRLDRQSGEIATAIGVAPVSPSEMARMSYTNASDSNSPVAPSKRFFPPTSSSNQRLPVLDSPTHNRGSQLADSPIAHHGALQSDLSPSNTHSTNTNTNTTTMTAYTFQDNDHTNNHVENNNNNNNHHHHDDESERKQQNDKNPGNEENDDASAII